jgi:hypothetical protein
MVKEATPHAPAPKSADENEWVNFGIAQTGQVNVANRDRQIERSLCRKIEEANDKAAEEAKKRTRRKVLGIF